MKVKFGGLKRVTSKTFDKLSAEDLTNSIVFIEDTGTVYVNGVLYGSSIDISSLAKQGENQEATNSAILDRMERILARSARYDTATGNLQFDNIDLTIV